MPCFRWGFTPLEEAKRFGFQDTANIIQEYIDKTNGVNVIDTTVIEESPSEDAKKR